MSRITIDIDDELIKKAMALYHLSSKRETVEFALKRLVGASDKTTLLALEGTGWHGELDDLRCT